MQKTLESSSKIEGIIYGEEIAIKTNEVAISVEREQSIEDCVNNCGYILMKLLIIFFIARC